MGMTDARKVQMLQNQLTRAADQFRFYERLHLAKEPADTDKASANAAMAEQCEEVVRATEVR
jgi:hypothetical protein